MKKILTEESRQYLVRQCKKGVASSKIAKDLNITARHVRRLWARFQATGTTRVKMGRPHVPVTAAQIRLVTGTHEGEPTGVLRTAGRLRHNHNISYRAVYRIMKKNGLVIPSAAKSKKRGYVRFERKYSNAMWHVDWHEMKDPRLKGLNLVTYLDDASRCITGAALFEHATSENAVMTLRLAIERFGTPASILSDNGSCFVGQNGRKKAASKGGTGMGTWQPTLFEEELLTRDIILINTRPYHPQTNGKLERFHGSQTTKPRQIRVSSRCSVYHRMRRLKIVLDCSLFSSPQDGSAFEAAQAKLPANPRVAVCTIMGRIRLGRPV